MPYCLVIISAQCWHPGGCAAHSSIVIISYSSRCSWSACDLLCLLHYILGDLRSPLHVSESDLESFAVLTISNE